jgi:2,3,4,5-tetrahydropyridine-2-carboxylate N-succinyltransferase
METLDTAKPRAQSKPLDQEHLKANVNMAWSLRSTDPITPAMASAIDETLALLDAGTLRAASRIDVGQWTVNTWVMRAAIMSLRMRGSKVVRSGELAFYDQPNKFHGMTDHAWQQMNWRVMAPASVRFGSYLGQGVFLLPSFIHVGAYIDENTTIDGFANIGSCAQIGKRVHIGACAAIGGVVEPMQPSPVIIEDDCFIGANASIVEGVVVEEGSVVAMGVQLGASTKILNRETGVVSYGRVPAGSVVVPGSMPSADGTHSTACAVIVKRVDDATLEKVRFNELLRT